MSLRATLVELSKRAGALGAQVNRAGLARSDPQRLARIDQKWLAAGKAMAEDESTETLVRAVNAHRVLIAELEETVRSVSGEAKAAETEADIAALRPRSHAPFWLVMVALLACAIAACNACYEHVIHAPMNFN